MVIPPAIVTIPSRLSTVLTMFWEDLVNLQLVPKAGDLCGEL